MFTVLSRVIAVIGIFCSCGSEAQSLMFTKAQVDAGVKQYRESCQICHGSSLTNGQFGTPLRGSFFRDKWKNKTLGELVTFIYEKMPPDNLMSLTPDQYTGLAAYILSRNDIAAAESEMTTDRSALEQIRLPW